MNFVFLIWVWRKNYLFCRGFILLFDVGLWLRILWYNYVSLRVKKLCDFCVILDEMGLGKMVELLVCIFVYWVSKEILLKVMELVNWVWEILMKYKCECIDCSCGVIWDDEYYDGLWV